MSNFINLKSRLFNQPLLVEPSYAQVLFGALADRLDITQLIDGDQKLDVEQLKEGAFNFSSDRTQVKPYRIKEGVAYIPVSGSLVAKSGNLKPYSGMTGYDGIKTNLDMAFSDEEVKSIVLELDSAGGEVNGCFELSDFIYENRETKHITALVTGLACSACYAIASACNKVVIAETATVGSIGVITAHTSVEKAMEDKGVKVTLIYAGDHKADGNPYKDLPDDVKNRLQGRLNKIYSMFTSRVSKYRSMSVDAIVGTQALTFMGGDAVEIGLADEVTSTLNFMSQTSGSNLNLENEMPDPIAETENENAIADAKAAGFKAGGVAMQERIQTIMNSEEADGRDKLASHLAFNTEMDAKDAIAMLGVAEKAVVEKPAEEASETTGFKEAMTELTAEDVGSDNVEDTEVTAESDPVKFAVQAYKQING